MFISLGRWSLLVAALIVIIAGLLGPAAAQETSDGDAIDDLVDADETLTVDPNGELLYTDPRAPGEEAIVAEAEPELEAEPEPELEVEVEVEDADTGDSELVAPTEFELASLPGAATTILLDFDGHVTTGTSWNAAHDIDAITTGPFDLDGDPETWSAEELQLIHDTWAVVAEDFAPWNVNVTTREPADPADLASDGPEDARFGARVVVTADDWSDCACGAQAYLGSFDDEADEPAFVFNTGFRGISEAASHALGHMLGLHHDGHTDSALYAGHEGVDGPDWAPIMGSAVNRAIGQWSTQLFVGADNIDQDDLAVISAAIGRGDGSGLRPDDHGDAGDPTPLNGENPTVEGVIGTRSDIDAFGFTTAGGRVSLSVVGDPVSPNLDAALTLLDADGEVVAEDDPTEDLSAAIDVEVVGGDYTVVVDGVGVGLPFFDPPNGYSDDASLGRYTLTGTIEGAPAADLEAPPAPEGLIGIDADGVILLGWAPGTDGDLDRYVVQRSRESGGPYDDLAAVRADVNGHEDPAPPAGDGYYVVLAVDGFGNRSDPSSEVLVTIAGTAGEAPEPDGAEPGEAPEPDGAEPEEAPEPDGPAPDDDTEPQNEELTEEPQRETPVYGAIVGEVDAITEADGVTQELTETLSGGAEPARHDRLDHRWAIPAAEGNQRLHVVAEADEDAGDADEGFVIGWSIDRTEWTPLVTILPGESIDDSFDIGAPEGTVYVRVRDTDRTPRQQSPDSVFVDLVQVVGDGLPVEPDPEPTEALAEVDFHYQGLGEGERAIVVTASVVDDQGDPVKRATVEVEVTGDVTERVTITTASGGTGVEQTKGAALQPDVEVCIADVQAEGLTWRPGPEDCPSPATDDPEIETDPGEPETDEPETDEPETDEPDTDTDTDTGTGTGTDESTAESDPVDESSEPGPEDESAEPDLDEQSGLGL